MVSVLYLVGKAAGTASATVSGNHSLFRLNADGANDLAKLGVLGTDQGSKSIGWLTARISADGFEPLARLRRSDDLGNLAVDAIDDRRRRASRRTYSHPAGEVVARYARLGHGRHVGHRLIAP